MKWFIKKLSKRLSQLPLPGEKSQKLMLARTQKFKINNKKRKTPAAVLILLYPFQDNWLFFLTKRTETVEHHKGQISLPGGMVEKNEELASAAVRETYEEIGVEKESIKIIGSLTPLYVPISNFEIFPFIGWTLKEPKTKMHDQEVERILKISIDDLLLEENMKRKKNMFADLTTTIPYFHLENEMVWGATSMILAEFKSVLEEVV